MPFDGSTYNPERDGQRLGDQMQAVFHVMKFGMWHSLGEIALMTGAPESSVSARLRDLRKPKFGGHTVEREYIHKGLFRYRLIVREDATA